METPPVTKARPYARGDLLRKLRLLPFLGPTPYEMRNLAYLDQHPEGVKFMYVKWWRVIATAASGMTIAILLYSFGF